MEEENNASHDNHQDKKPGTVLFLLPVPITVTPEATSPSPWPLRKMPGITSLFSPPFSLITLGRKYGEP